MILQFKFILCYKCFIDSDSISDSENAYGLHALVGVEMPLQNMTSSIFIEAELSTATLDVKTADDDFDVGGITLYAGIRF